MRRIVCAANKTIFTGEVIIGIRHYDSFMHIQYETRPSLGNKVEQGFIDNKGNFLTRTEAWVIANDANQIIRRVGGDDANGGTLYSENLY